MDVETVAICQKSAAKEVRQNGATTTEAPHTVTSHAREKQIIKMMSNKSRMDKKTKRQNKHSFFKASQKFLPDNIKSNGLMVDCGATSQIITEEDAFAKFDETFNPNAHYMELADGTRMNNVALKRGGAEMCLQDREGRCSKVTLKKALFIPSYPQSIFSERSHN